MSVKHKNALKATRLRGPAFSFGANYKELLQQKDKPLNLDEKEKKEVRARLERAIKNRRKSLLEQLDNKPKQSLEQPQQEPAQTPREQASQQEEKPQLRIDKEQLKQPQPEAGLPQISSLPVRKFKAG